jgi:ABC-type Fe3+-hydroxamate transport system substrate-binding protein
MEALPFAVILLLAVAMACGGGSSGASPTVSTSPTPAASRLVDIEVYHQVESAVLSAPGILGHVSYTDLDEIGNKVVVAVDTEDARVIAEREVAKLNLAPGSVELIIEPLGFED